MRVDPCHENSMKKYVPLLALYSTTGLLIKLFDLSIVPYTIGFIIGLVIVMAIRVVVEGRWSLFEPEEFER